MDTLCFSAGLALVIFAFFAGIALLAYATK